MQYAALLFGMLFLLMIIGVPISFSILGSCTIFLLLTNIKSFITLPQTFVGGMDNFVMLAVPLFTLTGYMMENLGLSKRLIDWVECVFGRIRGAQGAILIIASAIFAALTGSGPATVAAIGGLMIAPMIESGYKKETAAGLAAVSGTLGPIIPPSGIMIIYGATMGVSVSKMFLAGAVPGILIAAALVILNMILAKRWGIKATEKRYDLMEIIMLTKDAFGVLMLPIVVLGGIYTGIFTPTEAGTVSVLFCIALGILYKEISWKLIVTALKKTVFTGTAIMLIIAASKILGFILSAAGIPDAIMAAVLPYLANKYSYLILFTLILLLVGALMEGAAAVVILAPILVPIGIEMGFDPIYLGTIFCVNLIVGFVTPPFGVNIFSATSITGCSYQKVVKGELPFLLVLIAVLLLITFVPDISMILVNLLY